MTEFGEWKLQRARGVVLEYMRGLKPRADLKWCVGCLTRSFGLSPWEIDALLKSIENDPTVVMTPDRANRLELLKEALKKA
jgi:hypothetical protein